MEEDDEKDLDKEQQRKEKNYWHHTSRLLGITPKI